MQHQLASASGKLLRRNRRAGRLDKLCRCGLAWVAILCLVLLVGCTGPDNAANRRPDAPLAAQTPRAYDEPAPSPVATAPDSSVDAPVGQVTPAEAPAPPLAAAGETDVPPVSRGPTITFEDTVHDFGQVSPQSRNVCEFRFKNTGTATLSVGRKIDSTCGCTTPVLTKIEYAPGEEGVIKVTYSASSIAATARKYMTVHSNDPAHPQVKLTIVAQIVPRVAYEPTQLNLTPRDRAASCPPITLRSLDGQAFSVTGVLCTGNGITAEYDPSVEATEFTMQPRLNMERLQEQPAGYLVLTLTHPECKEVRIRYQMRPGYEFIPASLLLFNVKPNVPVPRDVWLANNYGDDFEIASFSSERNLVDVIEKQKVAAPGSEGPRYRLSVSVRPPAEVGEKGIFTDTLFVRLVNGPTLKLDCRGFYATVRARTAYPPP